MTRIVVSLPEKDNEFQLLQAVEARVAARRLGCQVDLLYANQSGIAQIQQIYKALGEEPRPRALVIEPIAQAGLETVLRRAASDGIGAALLNCTADYVTRLGDVFPSVPIFTVGSDQTAIGRLQGEQLRALLPRGGSVLCICGPQGSPVAEDRTRGLQDALDGADIRCFEIDGRWTEESAYHSVQSWLRLRSTSTMRMDVVAAQDDSMARGARRAMTESADAARWKDVPFIGIDGVPDVGQRMVDAGELAATIVMPSNTAAALEHLVLSLESGTMPPRAVHLPVHPYPEMTRLAARRPNGPAAATRPPQARP
jgi:ABC-type sugar transport system substrate-binding protein